MSSCGGFYVTSVLSKDQRDLLKVFIHAGKAGGCASAHLTSASNRINAETERKDRDLVRMFAEMTGIKCHQLNCCVSNMAHFLLGEEIMRSENAEDD